MRFAVLAGIKVCCTMQETERHFRVCACSCYSRYSKLTASLSMLLKTEKMKDMLMAGS